MGDQEAERLNTDLLATLRESAPWAAQQIDETVRQGKPIAKKVSRRGDTETVSIVSPTGSRSDSKFAATQDLTSTERLSITLDAVERLLVDPDTIIEEVRNNLKAFGVLKVEFTEPSQREDVRSEFGGRAANISSEHRESILRLLKSLRLDIANVR